jgi:hypothetical protein
MKLTPRAVAVGALLAAVAVAGLTAHPALAQGIGLDVWHLPDLRAGMSDSERQFRELEKRSEVIGRRLALRTEAIEDLLAGQIGIGEAVRRFDELNRLEPRTAERVRGMYPGDTDLERAGWQLAAHVRASPDPRAAEVADAVACRVAYPGTAD